MAGNRSVPTKKNAVIIGVIIAVLAIVAVTSTVVFLKNRGTTEATEFENPEVVATTGTNDATSNPDAGDGANSADPENNQTADGDNTVNPTGALPNAGNANAGNGNAENANAGNANANPNNIQEVEITETETTEEISGTSGSYLVWEEEGVDIDSDSKISNKIPTTNNSNDVNISKRATVQGEEIADIAQGDIITYIITVSSNKELKGIEISDVIPDETVYAGASEEVEEVLDEDKVVIGLRWTVDLTEENDYTAEVGFDVVVDEDAKGPIVNANAYANGTKLSEDDVVTTPISYTITYDLDNGKVDGENPEKYTAESEDITLINPTKTGYKFVGWTEEVDGVVTRENVMEVIIPHGSVGERKYTANWKAENYILTLDANGGRFTVVNYIWFMPYLTWPTTISKDITFGEEYGTLRTPDPRNGYTFTGWKDEDGNDITSDKTVLIAGDHTLYAQWEPDVYSITYNNVRDGEVDGENPTSYTIESDTIRLINPTRRGYDFDGWTGSNGFIASKRVVIRQGSTGNREYTANWTAKKIRVTLDSNAEDAKFRVAHTIGYGWFSYTYYTDEDTTEVEVTFDSPYGNLQEPTRRGYKFIGWKDEEGNDVNSKTIVDKTEPHTLYAQWELITYSITYDLDGGIVFPRNRESYTVESRDITLRNPMKWGYEFAGWTEEVDGVVTRENVMEVIIPHGSVGERKYTANWKAVKYAIHYYGLDKEPSEYGLPTEYTIEDEFTLNNPAKDGYTFNGWSGTDINIVGSLFGIYEKDVKVEAGNVGDRYYTAHFEANDYTVTLDGNGGTFTVIERDRWGRPINTTHPETITHDVTFDRPYGRMQEPTYPGYIFRGWNDKQDGTGNTVTNRTIVKIASDHTLYAQWGAKTIIININGEEQEVATGDRVWLDELEKRGYDFKGWYFDEGFTSKVDVDPETGKQYVDITPEMTESGATIYVYPKFEIITYSITYKETTAGTNPTEYTVESSDITLVNPTKTGYTFTGWNGTGLDGATMEVTIPHGSIGNRTYTATWEIDETATTELSYKVEYYKDGDKADEETITEPVWVNSTTIPVKASKINTTDKYYGYKFDSTNPATLPTEVAANETIKVYYVKDETVRKDLSYKVEYYKDGEKAAEETITENVWVNSDTVSVDTSKINTTNKFGDDYEFKSTDPTLPATVSNNATIKVYYETIPVVLPTIIPVFNESKFDVEYDFRKVSFDNNDTASIFDDSMTIEISVEFSPDIADNADEYLVSLSSETGYSITKNGPTYNSETDKWITKFTYTQPVSEEHLIPPSRFDSVDKLTLKITAKNDDGTTSKSANLWSTIGISGSTKGGTAVGVKTHAPVWGLWENGTFDSAHWINEWFGLSDIPYSNWY